MRVNGFRLIGSIKRSSNLLTHTRVPVERLEVVLSFRDGNKQTRRENMSTEELKFGGTAQLKSGGPMIDGAQN